MRSSAMYGAGAAPCTCPSSRARALRITSSAATSRGLSPGPVPSAASSSAKAIDSSTNSGGSSRRSAKPSSKASGPVSIRFWRIGFATTNLTAVSAPTRRGTSCVPPQAGTIPRKHSGHAKWRTAVEIVRALQWSASSTPPPRQAPLTAATVG